MKINTKTKQGQRLDIYDFYESVPFPRVRRFLVRFGRDWQLHLLMLLPIIHKIMFAYVPMYGVQIAFRSYSAKLGIVASDWVGLKFFFRFVENYKFLTYMWNTIALSLYSIFVSFPLPILLALLLNASRKERFKKVFQTVAYMPHFISTVVMVAIVNMVFSPVNGLYGNIFRILGGKGYPWDFRALPEAFRHVYTWSGVWQGIGWGTIMYTAALAGVPTELHEAATIDGATRWQRMLHVDIPSILPTICILFIMRFGSILSVGYQKVYLMQSDLNTSVSEIISTYVYKTGMSNVKNFSFASAVGMFNNVIEMILLFAVNKIVEVLSDNEIGLF